MRDSLWTLADAAWKKTRHGSGDPRDPPGVFREYSVSPPFPSQWPPDADSSVIYYLYATGHDPQRLADGCRIAAPWGLIRTTGGTESLPEFVRISENIREIGIQGVRPLQSNEMPGNGNGSKDPLPEIPAEVPEKDSAGGRQLRASYCFWCRNNGVIAGEIRQHHAPFFFWLECR